MAHHGSTKSSRHHRPSPTALAVAVLTVTATAGCAQYGMLQAQRALKQANQAYTAQDYVKAGALYEEAIKADPNRAEAYFYLANSYDNQYKPSRKGEAQNDALLDKAVTNYQLAADKLATKEEKQFKDLAKLSLDYLVATYGPDKLNDPAKAEPIIQKMIQLAPDDVENYFKLAKLYEDAGAYAEAEQVLLKSKDLKPKEPAVYLQLARFYNGQGPDQFPKTIEALEQRAAIEPNNPAAFHMIASYYWDETRLDAKLTEAQKRDYIQKGLEAADKALALQSEYVEAITFKGLLLRLQANLEKDPAKQQALMKEAVQLSDRANDLRKKQATGA